MSKSIFSKFTNLYSLSKTLKFELVPTEITKSHLDFEKDKSRAVHYKNIKVLFDQLHRKFINEGLSLYAKSDTDYNEFFRIYKEFLKLRKDKKDKKKEFEAITKEFDAIKTTLRKKVVEHFGICGENFKIKYNDIFRERWVEAGKDLLKFKPVLKAKGIEVLTEAGILEVLKYLVEKEELVIKDKPKEEIVKGVAFFDGFFTYFGSFNQTRENLYKSDGTATAIATRIIDENLVRFCDNIILLNTEIKLKNEQTIKPINIDLNYNKGIFDINSFHNFVTQNGIDNYNGGEKGDTNLGEFNKLFSKYIQDTFGQNKKLITKNLYIIMLSEKVSVFVEETQESCIDILKDVYKLQNKYLPAIRANYKTIWDNQHNDDFLERVFIKKENLAIISSNFFGGSNYGILERALKFCNYGKTEKEEIKLDPFLPLVSIKKALLALADGVNFDIKKSKSKKPSQDQQIFIGYKAGDLFKESLLTTVQKESVELWSVFIDVWQKEFNRQEGLNQNYNKVVNEYLLGLEKYTALAETKFELTIEEKGEEKKVVQTQANVAKLWLDSCMDLWHGVRMFEITKKDKKEYSAYTIHSDFYELVIPFADNYQLSKYYDKIRNFSTKKPFSTNKFKLNFDNASLLGGWDVNKEADNTSVIIKNGDVFELIIMDKKFNSFFDKAKNPALYQDGDILKMEYKLIPGPNKMLPKVAFADSNREIFKNVFAKYPRIEEIRKLETFKKEKNRDGIVEIKNKLDFIAWVDFFKDILKEQKDWKNFDWQFTATDKYQDVSEFYREVQIQGYKIKWASVNDEVLRKAEYEGKINRFEIKNKDWNKNSSGKPNLQTIFWKELFSEQNLINTCYKLNGEAEVFQRPKADNLLTRKDKNGNEFIKSKRFGEDTNYVHIPITLNFSAKEITKFNDYIKENLDQDNVNYLGIDRGENHLLYYSLINSNGEILDQGSLNTFNGVDYEDLLNKKQNARKDAKDKWAAIGNIKELKSGYLSLAIGKIIRLAIENNALIVLENLNYGFKKSRTIKFEKSVYQKFEVALATKLQHVVLKEKQPNELGGALNGLQLCPPLDITKLDGATEWGIIKYVGASYTSRICPLTSWHKTRYLKTVQDAKKAFNPDEQENIIIGFDKELKCYTFDDRSGNGLIYAHDGLVRNVYNPKEKDYSLRSKEMKGDEINDNLEKILGKFKPNGEFSQSEMWETLSDRNWKDLIYYFDLVCNIRVKQTVDIDGKKVIIDRIQSPILCSPSNCIIKQASKTFEPLFFDSTKSLEIAKKLDLKGYKNADNVDICPLPIDGDANGAYHIAKKGSLINS